MVVSTALRKKIKNLLPARLKKVVVRSIKIKANLQFYVVLLSYGFKRTLSKKIQVKTFLLENSFDRKAQDYIRYLANVKRSYFPTLDGCHNKTWVDEKLVVMIVVSDLRREPRVEREAKTLAKMGYKIVVICPDMSSPSLLSNPISWDKNIFFDIVGKEAANFNIYFPWIEADELLKAAIKYNPYAYHCHDLNTALVGWAASKLINTKLVCDFHEWFSENVSWDPLTSNYVPHKELKRQIYQGLEALVVNKADHIITVCESIANDINSQYLTVPRQIEIIRNIPLSSKSVRKFPSLREITNVKDRFIILWQGGTGPSRNIEPIIEALQYLSNVCLIIRGTSLEVYGRVYEELAKKIGVDERLILLPPVDSCDVVAAANGADVGIWSLPDFGKNFSYALPNKIFEYLHAGLPLVCADYPEVRSLIDQFKIGTLFDPYDPQSIASAVTKIMDKDFLKRCKVNISISIKELDPDREWGKLSKIYPSRKNHG